MIWLEINCSFSFCVLSPRCDPGGMLLWSNTDKVWWFQTEWAACSRNMSMSACPTVNIGGLVRGRKEPLFAGMLPTCRTYPGWTGMGGINANGAKKKNLKCHKVVQSFCVETCMTFSFLTEETVMCPTLRIFRLPPIEVTFAHLSHFCLAAMTTRKRPWN